jgi:hypothetical protein
MKKRVLSEDNLVLTAGILKYITNNRGDSAVCVASTHSNILKQYSTRWCKKRRAQCNPIKINFTELVVF